MAKLRSVKATLKAARKLLSDPKRWTKGNFAKDTFGRSTEAVSRRAVAFCVLGALQRVDGKFQHDAEAVLANTCWALFGEELTLYNDSKARTHKQILALFDEAIKSS